MTAAADNEYRSAGRRKRSGVGLGRWAIINSFDHIADANSGPGRGTMACDARDDQVTLARSEPEHCRRADIETFDGCAKCIVETKERPCTSGSRTFQLQGSKCDENAEHKDRRQDQSGCGAVPYAIGNAHSFHQRHITYRSLLHRMKIM